MDHAITVGMVVWTGGIALVGILALGGLVLLLAILNPFRSGH